MVAGAGVGDGACSGRELPAVKEVVEAGPDGLSARRVLPKAAKGASVSHAHES